MSLIPMSQSIDIFGVLRQLERAKPLLLLIAYSLPRIHYLRILLTFFIVLSQIYSRIRVRRVRGNLRNRYRDTDRVIQTRMLTR